MNGPAERLLTFEVHGNAYALPIASVAEVANMGRLACIPTVPPEIGAITNHHGDALPVIHREVLFELEGQDLGAPEHLLVLEEGEESARIGVPVDRICGLADGQASRALGNSMVAERRPLDGRVVQIIDPQKLIQQVGEIFRRAVLAEPAVQGDF